MENKSTISESKNLKTVLELPYLVVYLNEEREIFELYWRKSNFEMSTSEFQTYLDTFSRLFEKYSVRGFYVDTRAYHITMDVEIQAWHDQYIVPRYLAGGVRKIAFVLPYEFISALSIEQAFEEPQARQLEVRYFENESRAREWINFVSI
jgi:hypothetical protein